MENTIKRAKLAETALRDVFAWDDVVETGSPSKWRNPMTTAEVKAVVERIVGPNAIFYVGKVLRKLTGRDGGYPTTIIAGDGSQRNGRFWPMPPLHPWLK